MIGLIIDRSRIRSGKTIEKSGLPFLCVGNYNKIKISGKIQNFLSLEKIYYI